MACADLEGGALMQVGLSSAAAPDAGAKELIEACAKRGLTMLELRAGDAHGIDTREPWLSTAQTIVARANAAGVRIAGWRAGEREPPGVLAQLSLALDAPVTVASGDIAQRVEKAAAIQAAGGRSLVLTAGNARIWHERVSEAGIDYAWEIDATCTRVASDADLLLGPSPSALRYIRLIGGGPEATLHEGRGIGSLMGRLALSGFQGAVILSPSAARYHVVWSAWLGRRGGWGCGSKGSSPELVRLPTHNTTEIRS